MNTFFFFFFLRHQSEHFRIHQKVGSQPRTPTLQVLTHVSCDNVDSATQWDDTQNMYSDVEGKRDNKLSRPGVLTKKRQVKKFLNSDPVSYFPNFLFFCIDNDLLSKN